MPLIASLSALVGLLSAACVAAPVAVPVEIPVVAAPTPEERWGARTDAGAGRLRILVPAAGDSNLLPRSGNPLDFETALALEFAESLGLTPIVVSIAERSELLPALLAGWGDVVVANLTVTAARAERVAFTDPVAHAREQLVTRSDDLTLTSEAALSGRRLAVRESSSFADTARQLVARNPELLLEWVPEELDSEQLLYRVSSGEYDIAIADSNLVEAVLTYRPELRVAFDLSEERPLAWALRPADTELKAELDAFLRSALPGRTPARSRGDLPEIVQRKALRVLTRNSGATYFVYRGQLLGFEFELAERFAKSQGLYLELVVPPTRSALIPWLKEGRGDLIAASLTPTRERDAQGVTFSEPYKFTHEVVVSRNDEFAPTSQAELAGRTLVVRRSSSYWQTAMQLQADGARVEVVVAPEDLETEEIIARVASGEYDLTIADSHIVEIELAWRQNVRAALPLSENYGHRWVVRGENPELLRAVNDFLRRESNSRGIAKTLRRYFSSPWRTKRYVKHRALRSGTISPYDALIRKYATEHDLDWRLIVSQMYQESRFDPQAESPAGAKGLMQFMPETARRYGLRDRTHPEHSIRAGIRYMANLRDDDFAELPAGERIWFALAAYNAGPGHVTDARRIAVDLGLDPDRWFGNVEEGILLLAKRQYHRNTRFGYCRGSEPFAYVREIRARYQAYEEATPLVER